MLWIGGIVGLLIALGTAYEFKDIAAKKGFNDSKYFWWTFAMLPVGAMMVIALPDRGKAVEQATAQAADELPDL